MRCETFETMASAYLDEELNAHELQASRSHLAICPLCRNYLQELQNTSACFKEIPRPEAPRELHSYVMVAIERRVKGEISLRQRAIEWMMKLNPRPFSFATGAVVSVILFAATLSGFRPLPVDTSKLTTPPLTSVPQVPSSLVEYNLYNNLPATKASSSNEEYELPQMNSSSMVSFSNLAYQKPGDEGMAALVQIGVDGRARIVDVLDDPKDPMVVEQFWFALMNPTFKPATINGEPVATQIVMLVEKMDVGG
ncbi:MAG: hypothetical protein HY231_07970 [Acidobacteria bacterium]|nr:hypothetical protein [Acidobacteriota bacterium]